MYHQTCFKYKTAAWIVFNGTTSGKLSTIWVLKRLLTPTNEETVDDEFEEIGVVIFVVEGVVVGVAVVVVEVVVVVVEVVAFLVESEGVDDVEGGSWEEGSVWNELVVLKTLSTEYTLEDRDDRVGKVGRVGRENRIELLVNAIGLQPFEEASLVAIVLFPKKSGKIAFKLDFEDL